MNVLIILLGCHISYLLNDRINTAIHFVKNQYDRNTNIIWFLSGGIKNPFDDTVPEALKMGAILSASNVNQSWSYIYDTESKNTAENFVMANNYITNILKSGNTDFRSTFLKGGIDEIYVVTSSFHYERAKKMSDMILGEEVKWILGNAELHDSRYWEQIHIKNVEKDVYKALEFYIV